MKKTFVKLSALILAVVITFPAMLFASVKADSADLFEYTVFSREATITECSAEAYGRVEVPAELGGCPVTTVESLSFAGCDKITEIVLPDCLKTVCDYAFSGCSALSEVFLPEGLEVIGERAFSDCGPLASLTLSHSVSEIGAGAFDGCADGFIIRGYAGGEVERYAKENDITFVSLGNIEDAHTWSEWKISLPATETRAGSRYRICSVCNKKEEESISPYSDLIHGTWYEESALWCIEKGFMSNTANTHFSPDAVLTRAQFVQILAKVSGARLADVEYSPVFTDLPDGRWYSKAVIWAAKSGVTGGVGGGLFAPDASVTRAQLAVFITAYAEKTGFEFSGDADLSVYADCGNIPAWAVTALKKCVSEGIISGTAVDCISPDQTATRAQTAVIIRKLVMRINCLGNVLIFGDSISAYAGTIPDGFGAYYPYVAGTLVDASEQMWWSLLMSETGSDLVMNNSWSGSTICYTGYDGYQPSQSFLFRAETCLKNGECYGKKIDTVIIQGGGNDTGVSPYGEVMYSDWTRDDLCACLPAFCKLLHHVKNETPDARIIFMLNEHFPDAVYYGMKAACEHYDVECVLFGATAVFDGHPSRLGMVQIKDQILDQIDKCKLTPET